MSHDHPSFGWAEDPRMERPVECEARRYDRRPCDGPPTFLVQYRTADRSRVTDEHPACFRHGLAEVDRHSRSGGIAPCDLVGLGAGYETPTSVQPGEVRP